MIPITDRACCTLGTMFLFLPYVIHLPLTAARCKLLLFNSANPHEKACQAPGPSCMLVPQRLSAGEGVPLPPPRESGTQVQEKFAAREGSGAYFNHRLTLPCFLSLCGSQHGPCLASQGAVPRALHPYLPCLSLHRGWDGPPTVPGREGKYLYPRCQVSFLPPPGATAAAPGRLPGSGVQSAPPSARPGAEP